MDFDTILVGGGLQSALIALALLHKDPTLRLCVVEKAAELGGNHTWCFHEHDVPAAAQPWVEPLVAVRWPRQEVRFPNHRRVLEQTYSLVSSERLGQVLSALLADSTPAAAAGSSSSQHRIVLSQAAMTLSRDSVTLENGERLTGRLVVDARGPSNSSGFVGRAGFQKFVGLEVRTVEPHGFGHPVLMDAEVAQRDGYRFVYVLPLGPRELLVEDTLFSNTPELQRARQRREVEAYLERLGLEVEEVLREEWGVLPMPWSAEDTGDSKRPSQLAQRVLSPLRRAPRWVPFIGALNDSEPNRDEGPLVAGYRGGWFHPATGYSFPVALRVAQHVASRFPVGEVSRGFRERHEEQVRFAHLLNAMLFRLVPGPLRWRIFRRFYRLPESTIGRFYALNTTLLDRVAILAGFNKTVDIK